jgi:hypothetical protein
MIVQLIARNTKMINAANITLNILLQIPISKLIQFISSGGGG